VRATIEARDYQGFGLQVQQLIKQKMPYWQIKMGPPRIKIAHQ
jgi:hypothetical protein